MLENVKCGSHQKNGMSLGPENTKSDILKRTSKLARHPPSPMSTFFCFSGTPLPPLSCGRPLCMAPYGAPRSRFPRAGYFHRVNGDEFTRSHFSALTFRTRLGQVMLPISRDENTFLDSSGAGNFATWKMRLRSSAGVSSPPSFFPSEGVRHAARLPVCQPCLDSL